MYSHLTFQLKFVIVAVVQEEVPSHIFFHAVAQNAYTCNRTDSKPEILAMGKLDRQYL